MRAAFCPHPCSNLGGTGVQGMPTAKLATMDQLQMLDLRIDCEQQALRCPNMRMRMSTPACHLPTPLQPPSLAAQPAVLMLPAKLLPWS